MTDQGRLDFHGLSHSDEGKDHYAIAQMRRTARIHGSSLSIEDDSRLFGPTSGFLFTVADGLGDVHHGAVASSVLVRDLVKAFLEDVPWSRDEPLEPAVRGSLERFQDQLLALGKGNVPAPRPGSTVTLAFVRWPELVLVHIGDGRCYLHRDGELHQLSRDHTMGAVVRASGIGSAEEVSEADSRVWNAVGSTTHPPFPQIERSELSLGDELVLCTGGVWRSSDQETIHAALRAASTAEEAARALVLRGDGKNQTAIVARFLAAEGESQATANPDTDHLGAGADPTSTDSRITA